MFLHVTDAKYLKEYTVWVAFNDGKSGNADLSSELWGEVFEPLKDVNYFKRMSITLNGCQLL